MKILLIEDNINISEGLKYSFLQNNYEIEVVTNVEKAIKLLSKDKLGFKSDLIILDISLPDGNGFELYEDYIKQIKIPTIFLTAKDSENDIVKGLELGAEDYITKPFSTRELLARVNKIILKNKENTIIKVKNISFDIDKMVVKNNNDIVNLTSLELKILYLLFTNLNKVIRRGYIIDKIWDWTGNDVNDNTVTVYLKRIREKIGEDIIATIKGIGYRVDVDEK